MNYLGMVITVLPAAAFIAAGLYGILYLSLKNKRQKPSLVQAALQFALVGWFVLFLYVTQGMSFGNGMGSINLLPLKPIFLAIKYGSVNAGMVIQILLNILMCIPLGLLLPLVAKKRFAGFLPVLGLSFAIASLTEASQLLGGRSADIDDVIANTLGGVLGFALYVFWRGILYLTRAGGRDKSIGLDRYRLNLAISFLLVFLTLSPIAVIKVLEGKSEFGVVYYGHLTPARVEIPHSISDAETTASVYKNIQVETRETLQSRLIQLSGFDCEFKDVGYGTLQCGEEGDERVIFIYPYNTWAVLYHYGDSRVSDPSRLPSETEGVKIALEALEAFGIALDTLEYAGLRQEYGDEKLYLEFADQTSTNERLVWGKILVIVGEAGELVEISDRRTTHELVNRVETISPRKAIEIAVDIGVGEWEGSAAVTGIEPYYYFNEDTGYLIPTWQIHGSLAGSQGQTYDWAPNVDAIK